MSKYLVDHKSLIIHRTAYICHACQHHFISENNRDFINNEETIYSLVAEHHYKYCPSCTENLNLPPYF